jgi:hypothetical protein
MPPCPSRQCPYASITEDNESLSGQTKVALAPRGPVAGTVDVVKT